MKPKSISRFSGLRHTSTLALVTAITAFAAGNVFAATWSWDGGAATGNWTDGANWNPNILTTYPTGFPLFNQAPTIINDRISVNGTQSLDYTLSQGNTIFGGNTIRGLVIGSASNGSMNITGGTFSTEGNTLVAATASSLADVLGNLNSAAVLSINGGNYVSGASGLYMGLGGVSPQPAPAPSATLNIANGSATVTTLALNTNSTTVNLNSGGILAANSVNYLSWTSVINFDGGTLRARPTAITNFLPNGGGLTAFVKSGGAIIDTNGVNITVGEPLLTDAVSLGGGITKNGTGNLTLGGVSTTTGPAIVNAGGLSVPAGLASWKPSLFTHSGNVMTFAVGIFNPSNVAMIDSTGAVSFNNPTTVNVTGSQFVIGQIPLLKYDTLSGFANLTLNPATLPPGVLATLNDDTVNKLIYLDVTQGGFVWSGDSDTAGTGDWDTTSSNWNSFLATYSDPAPVTFPTIPGGGTVTIPADVSPAAVDFTNTAGNDYLLAGAGKIIGSANVNKTGNGKVILNNTNTYAGNTNINAGILSIATTGSLPGWNANSRYPIASGATLAVQNAVSDANVATMLATTGNFAAGAILGFDTEADDRTYAANLTGSIGVANVGSNILTLSGTNSHTGTTLVASGSIAAGSSTAFTGTGPLVMNAFTSFDLGAFNASFTTINAGALSNSITASAAGTGTSTLSLLNGGASFVGAITDGSTRKIALKCRAANASNVPNNQDNTYSGGLTLLGGIDAATSGTRLNPFSTFTTVDENGVVTSGPYGTGPISIGEISTDRVQVYFNAAGRIIANDIIVNSTAGTDTVGTFRVESTGNLISGAILANEASAFFRNNVTNGSAGNGEMTLTGPISTGSNPAAGLTVTAAGVNTLALTLNNQTAVANSHTGATTVTGGNTTLILGAANQIPNGSGKGNVVMATSKLDLAGFSETINGLSGSGTVDNLSTGTANTLTLGDGDASASFSGTIANTNGELTLVKVGSGNQTFTSFHTYSGPTTVRGGTLGINSSLDSPTVTIGGATATGSPTLTGAGGTINGTLVVAAAGGGAEGTVNPGTAGTTGSLNVSDTTIAGTFACDVVSDAADALFVNGSLDISGAKFALNTVSPVGGTYTIATYSGTLTGTFTPVPALPDGASLDYATAGEIKLVLPAAAGYAGWITGFGLPEADQDPTDDPDHDGISNLMEYVLFNGQPAVSSTSILPTLDASGANFIFTLYRRTDSAADTTQIFQYGPDLSSWTDVAIPAGSGVTVTPNTPSLDIDKIEISVVKSPNTKLFGRLEVIKP